MSQSTTSSYESGEICFCSVCCWHRVLSEEPDLPFDEFIAQSRANGTVFDDDVLCDFSSDDNNDEPPSPPSPPVKQTHRTSSPDGASPVKKQRLVEIIDLTVDDDDDDGNATDDAGEGGDTTAVVPTAVTTLNFDEVPTDEVPTDEVPTNADEVGDDDDADYEGMPPLEEDPPSNNPAAMLSHTLFGNAQFKGNLFHEYSKQYWAGRLRLSHRMAVRAAVRSTFGRDLPPKVLKEACADAKRRTSSCAWLADRCLRNWVGKSATSHKEARGLGSLSQDTLDGDEEEGLTFEDTVATLLHCALATGINGASPPKKSTCTHGKKKKN
eukprot:TRINITY_DN65516_c0_g1_i1.p1 TRINITY_DN65516_c0_g1~~TRINITY_DN65516_c0_g1_i1.p1  ORF type:complete len:325 (-),score=48.35 TRINITY_DN65516_c0_g1_i1:233-1207(-)